MGIDFNIIRDEMVHDSYAPVTLQVFKNKTAESNAHKMEAKFLSLFPFLKKQMGKYRVQFMCTVTRDASHGWPVSIEWDMSESVSPVSADVVCKIELV